MATILDNNGITFGTNGTQSGDNFGFMDDASALGYVENVYYYNTSGRTQIFYVSKTGTTSFPKIITTTTWWTGVTNQRNNLTYVVPNGSTHAIESGGTLYSWTGNLFNE